MRRFGAMIPDELDDAMKRVSDRTGIPLATLVRNALMEYLKQYGEEVKLKPVKRGGYRPRRKDEPKASVRLPMTILRKAAAQASIEPHLEPVIPEA